MLHTHMGLELNESVQLFFASHRMRNVKQCTKVVVDYVIFSNDNFRCNAKSV